MADDTGGWTDILLTQPGSRRWSMVRAEQPTIVRK
jgi:hypothetical protein